MPFMTESIVCPDPSQCCKELSRVWNALGTDYNGKSASENVAAVMAHRDELLAALRAAEEFVHSWMSDNTGERELRALEQIESALAKAETVR